MLGRELLKMWNAAHGCTLEITPGLFFPHHHHHHHHHPTTVNNNNNDNDDNANKVSNPYTVFIPINFLSASQILTFHFFKCFMVLLIFK